MSKFLGFLTDMFGEIPSKDRLKVLAVLGYIFLPKDKIPEEKYGAAGFIDDVFLSAWVAKEIKNKLSKEQIKKYWLGDPQDIDEAYKHSQKVLEEAEFDTRDILEYAGIKKV